MSEKTITSELCRKAEFIVQQAYDLGMDAALRRILTIVEAEEATIVPRLTKGQADFCRRLRHEINALWRQKAFCPGDEPFCKVADKA